MASVAATAQTIPGLNAEDQRNYDSLNLAEKTKLFQVVLGDFNSKTYQCAGNNPLIVGFCENAVKTMIKTDSDGVIALASPLGEIEKAQAKSSTDAALKRMDANIKAAEERIDNLSHEELASDAGSAKTADLSADNMLNHVTDQASFDAAIPNFVNLGLLPVGTKATTYSPELVAKMKSALEESATKFGEAQTKATNYRPWWMTAIVVAIASLFSQGRKKTSKASTPPPAAVPPPPPPTPEAIV